MIKAYIHKAGRGICSAAMSVLVLNGLGSFVWAQDGGASELNAGDTAWVLMSSALVLAMIIPGLALFYGGMVRSKNVLSTMMHSFIAVCLVSVCGSFGDIVSRLRRMWDGSLGDSTGWD